MISSLGSLDPDTSYESYELYATHWAVIDAVEIAVRLKISREDFLGLASQRRDQEINQSSIDEE